MRSSGDVVLAEGITVGGGGGVKGPVVVVTARAAPGFVAATTAEMHIGSLAGGWC